ncbi:major facilitator superfamily domain-containing protein [Aspergillus floccosus]
MLFKPSVEYLTPSDWTLRRKLFHTITPSLFAFLITFGTSVVEPGLLGMMEDFQINRTTAISGITLYTFGLAGGPLFLAPLSEIYGRRWIYVASSSCLLAFTAGAAAARNLATFLVCRFFAGFLGSVGIAVGAGSIADIWPEDQERAVASVFFVLCPFLAPSIAPIVGTYVMRAHDDDWRWTQWVTLLIGAPIWVFTLLMQETSQPNRASQSGHCSTVDRARMKHLPRAISLPFRMLYTDWIVLALTLHTAFGYAIIFSFFSSIYYVLGSAYGFDTQQASTCLLSLVIGYSCAILMCSAFERIFCSTRSPTPDDTVIPEKKLYAGIAGNILMVVGEAWYALAARQGGNWAVLVAAGIPLGWGVFALFVTIAANGAIRYTLGAVFPLFTLQIYEELGINWGSAVFAVTSLLLLPIPWFLCKYGEQIRSRTHKQPPRDVIS